MLELTLLDQVIILAYLGFVPGVGLRAGRRVKDLEEYAVAGRSYKALIIAANLSASLIGGVFHHGQRREGSSSSAS